jgi:hypothetical protein
MPVTRRQSGKLQPSQRHQDKAGKDGEEREEYVEEEYFWDMDEIADSDSESSDDSGSEWGKRSRKLSYTTLGPICLTDEF